MDGHGRDARAGREGESIALLASCSPLSLSSIKEATTMEEKREEMEGAEDGGGGEAIPSWETLSVLAFGEGRGEGRKTRRRRRRRRRIRSSERHLKGEGQLEKEGRSGWKARDRERR